MLYFSNAIEKYAKRGLKYTFFARNFKEFNYKRSNLKYNFSGFNYKRSNLEQCKMLYFSNAIEKYAKRDIKYTFLREISENLTTKDQT